MSDAAGPARPGIRSQPPPAWLLRHVVNPLTRSLLLSPLARWTGHLALLCFATRRTGRNVEIPVSIYEFDGSLVVFTGSPWAANFRGGRPVILIRRGRHLHGEGRLVEDPHETAVGLRTALGQVSSPTRLGLRLDTGYQPSNDELAKLRRMIRFTVKERGPTDV